MAQESDQNTTTTYNLTIDDTSPRISYIPSPPSNYTGEPDLNAGWSQYVEGLGFSTFPGQSALCNQSFHVTTRNGAELSIPFTGTNIEIYGILFQSTLSLSIDGGDPQTVSSTSFPSSDSDNNTSSSTIDTFSLGSISGLEQGSHILSLTAHTTATDADSDSDSGSVNGIGLVLFDRAVVTVSTSLIGASVETDEIPDTQVSFIGSWTFEDDIDSSDSDSTCSANVTSSGNSSFHITQNAGDHAQYSFQGSAVEVMGLTNASSGLYNVSLSSSNGSLFFNDLQLSGFSSFLTYTTLFYAYGLNDSMTYTLTITNAEDSMLAVDGLNITVLSGGKSVTSTSPPVQITTVSGLSHGAIAGIAVASALALIFLLVAFTLLLFWFRRKRKSIQRQHEAGYGPWPRSRSQSRNASRTQSALYVGGYVFDKKNGNSMERERQMREVQSPTTQMFSQNRSPNRSPLHRRMFSTEIVPINPARPGRRASVPQSVLVGENLSAIHEGRDVMEVDVEDVDPDQTEKCDDETDSGLGDEKRQSLASSALHTSTLQNLASSPMPSRSNTLSMAVAAAANIPPTRRRSRRQSNPLGRWSGWFTSSSRSSSDSSKLSLQFSSVPPSFPSPPPVSAQTARHPPLDRPQSTNSGSIGAQARDMLVSFLDFASSASNSLRDSTRSLSRSQRSQRHYSSSNKSMVAQSNVSNVGIHSITTGSSGRTPRSVPTTGSGSNSNGNNASIPQAPQDSAPQSTSGSGSASTGMWTLSLSVDPPRQPARLRDSQDLVPHTAVSATASPIEPPPVNRHPFSMASADLHPQRPNVSTSGDAPESPTDSLPMSVSDINFRNDEDDDDSPIGLGSSTQGLRTGTSETFSPVRSGSTSGIPRFQLPRHPPLPRTSPGTPQSYTYAYNVPTPTRLDYGDPGLARSGHMRQMSAPDLSLRAAAHGQTRAPYEAQTTFGRRLAQVRAQALEAQTQTQPQTQQTSASQSQGPNTPQSGGDIPRPPSRGFRALPIPPLPFMHHLNRSGSG